MNSGRYDKKLRIWEATETVDAQGSLAETWSTYVTPYASRVDLRGRELMDREKVNAMLNVRFRIRYIAGITTKMVVTEATAANPSEPADDGDIFDIGAVLNSAKRQAYIDLMCVLRNA